MALTEKETAQNHQELTRLLEIYSDTINSSPFLTVDYLAQYLAKHHAVLKPLQFYTTRSELLSRLQKALAHTPSPETACAILLTSEYSTASANAPSNRPIIQWPSSERHKVTADQFIDMVNKHGKLTLSTRVLSISNDNNESSDSKYDAFDDFDMSSDDMFDIDLDSPPHEPNKKSKNNTDNDIGQYLRKNLTPETIFQDDDDNFWFLQDGHIYIYCCDIANIRELERTKVILENLADKSYRVEIQSNSPQTWIANRARVKVAPPKTVSLRQIPTEKSTPISDNKFLISTIFSPVINTTNLEPLQNKFSALDETKYTLLRHTQLRQDFTKLESEINDLLVKADDGYLILKVDFGDDALPWILLVVQKVAGKTTIMTTDIFCEAKEAKRLTTKIKEALPIPTMHMVTNYLREESKISDLNAMLLETISRIAQSIPVIRATQLIIAPR